MDRRGDTSAARDEFRGGIGVQLHDGSRAEQSAEFYRVPDGLAHGGNDADGGGLGVCHADGNFVGDQPGNDLLRRVAGNGDHVEAYRAYAGHRLELVYRQRAALGRGDHALVLGYRDERARQAADVAGGHDAALFHGVV